MSKWEMVRLGEVSTKITDGSHNPPKGVASSKYLMLSSKNIDDDDISYEDPRYLSIEDFKIENRRTNISLNDVLLTIVGTVGRCAVVQKELPLFTLQRSVAVIKPKLDKIDSRFLMYSLQSKRKVLEGESRGVAQKGIYLKQISNVTISLPPLEVQQQIARALDQANSLIQKRKAQIDKLDLLVKSQFIEMFGDPVTNPEGWEKKALNTVCDVRDGTHDSPKYVVDGYPLLTSKNFTKGFVDFSDANLISKEDFEAINKRSRVDVGDIVMPMIGTIGSPVIVDTNLAFAIKNVALIKFSGDEISNIYLHTLLSTRFLEYSIRQNNRGGTQKFIALGDIRRLFIPIPPLVLQNQFANFVHQVEIQKSLIQQSLAKLELNYKSLMQKCFRGEIIL